MKKILSFIIVLTMLMSIMAIGASAAVTEQTVKLFDEAAGAAKGYGSGYIIMTWANNCGMKFDVNQDELLTGATFRTIVKDVRIKAYLYKWNTSLQDKELLEAKELQSVDWLQVVFDFDTVYTAGTYYVEVQTFGDAGNKPYLYAQNKIITDRNVAAFQYDKTWAELNSLESSIKNGYNFGEGFDMSIKTLKGVTANAQSFVAKYKEAKVEDVTVYDQAKYDAVINAVGSDLKAFMTSATDETLGNYVNDLTAALTAPVPTTEPTTAPTTEPTTAPTNPKTDDEATAPFIMMFTLAAAAMVVFAVIMKRSNVKS